MDKEDSTFSDYTNEPTLSETERTFRDKFVEEYLVDFDYTSAAVRVGFSQQIAYEFGQKFRYDSYVQREIAKRYNVPPTEEELDGVAQRQRVIHALEREANYRGAGASHAARVAALSKLSAIHGIEAPTKTESKITHAGGQEIVLKNQIDFSSCDEEDRKLIRQLLEKRISEGE